MAHLAEGWGLPKQPSRYSLLNAYLDYMWHRWNQNYYPKYVHAVLTEMARLTEKLGPAKMALKVWPFEVLLLKYFKEVNSYSDFEYGLLGYSY